MNKEKYGLNDEQWSAIVTPSPIYLGASAGSGKTKTLISKILYLLDLGESPNSILGITFTNKAAKEMKERLAEKADITGMQISTIHSMCVRIMHKFIRHTYLKEPFSIYDDGNQLSIIKTIIKSRKLCGDPYEYLSAIGVAKSEGIEPEDDDVLLVYSKYQEILKQNNAVDFDDLQTLAYECLKHEDCKKHYSNLWTNILVDEFQDVSNIQFKLITTIYNPAVTKTMFCVGDKNQCLVAGSILITKNGNVKIEDVAINEKIKCGKGQKDTGFYQINNKYYREVSNFPVITIKTESGYSLTTTYEHLYFADFKKIPTKVQFYVYLMFRKDRGYRIGFTQNVRGGGKLYPLVHGFKIRCNQEHGDAVWILGVFDQEKEARYYEHLYSIKYGISTWVFHTSYRQLSLSYDDQQIERLYKNLNTEKGALSLLKDLGLFKEYPHHVPKCMSVRRRRNFTITLCGHRDTHKFAINGSDLNDAATLKNEGLNVRSQKNRKGYRVEGSLKDLSKIYAIKEKIEKHLALNTIITGRFSDHGLQLTPASHLIPGMLCFVLNKDNSIIDDTIIEVKKETYTGPIFDLDIDQVHNFIANGIVTHNSIYGWRSAKPENVDKFIKNYKANALYLTYNYRSCPEVIAHANKFLQFGKPMIPKSNTLGKISFTQFLNQDDEACKIADAISKMDNIEDTAILFRVNSRSLLFEKAFAQRKIPYKVVGALPYYKRKVVKDLLSYCKASLNRSDTESLIRIVNTPKRGFGEAKQEQLLQKGWAYLEETAEEMSSIRYLITLLNDIKNKTPVEAVQEVLHRTEYKKTLDKENDLTMIDSFIDVASGFNNTEELILASTFLEEDSGHGVKLMSAHASKGLEFDRVFVVGVEEDLWPHAKAPDVLEEKRLFFVAVSRAKRYLNLSYSKSRLYRGQQIAVRPSNLFIESCKSS